MEAVVLYLHGMGLDAPGCRIDWRTLVFDGVEHSSFLEDVKSDAWADWSDGDFVRK